MFSWSAVAEQAVVLTVLMALVAVVLGKCYKQPSTCPLQHTQSQSEQAVHHLLTKQAVTDSDLVLQHSLLRLVVEAVLELRAIEPQLAKVEAVAVDSD